MKKRKQRKYVRYERAHSVSMWQGDGKEYEIDRTKRWDESPAAGGGVSC